MNDFSRKKFRRLEIIGAVIVCICAPILHFTFAWSGENFAVGLFSAVNESVWEHTKLIYFPMLVFCILLLGQFAIQILFTQLPPEITLFEDHAE